jgi:hypothetical protein
LLRRRRPEKATGIDHGRNERHGRNGASNMAAGFPSTPQSRARRASAAGLTVCTMVAHSAAAVRRGDFSSDFVRLRGTCAVPPQNAYS